MPLADTQRPAELVARGALTSGRGDRGAKPDRLSRHPRRDDAVPGLENSTCRSTRRSFRVFLFASALLLRDVFHLAL
jgi:hypothetical protein